MNTFLQDLRYGIRMLFKSPGFTTVAVLSLTLGIGANTTIFTLAKAIFLHSIPVKDPGSVVVLYSTALDKSGKLQEYIPTPLPNAIDYRNDIKSFSGAAIDIGNGFSLIVSGKKTQVPGQLVNGNFFDVLGVKPMIGRALTPDDEASRRPVVVLSYDLWNTQFGADKGILGKTIQLDQMQYSVIGVMPSDFRGVGNLGSPSVWIPISLSDDVLTGVIKTFLHQRAFRLTAMIARLKPGVSVEQAGAEVHALGLQLEKQYPKDNNGRNEEIVPINETTVPPQLHGVFSLAGVLLMGIVGLVLLIACANVANLLLSRATQRQREIAVRLALGASRSRLVRQLLTESLLIALLAGGLGIFCAFWAKSFLVSLLPPFLTRNLDFTLDARVFIYTLALAVIATLIFGLMPALQASRGDTVVALKDRTGAPTGSGRWYGLRGVLVMVQVALSLIALVGAGLFIHSLRNAEAINPGFEVQHEMVAFVNVGAENYDQPRAEALYRDVIQRLDTMPMIAAASLSDTPPLGGNISRTTFTDGVDSSDPRNGKLTPIVNTAPGYFSAAGITMLQGRDFTDADTPASNLVGIVNRTAAESFWPGKNPIGQHLHFLGETWDVTVVGEVNTVKFATLGEAPQAVIYMPLKQHYSPAVMLFVRSKGSPSSVIPSVRSVMKSLAPSVPLVGVQTVDEVLVQSLTAPRIGAELLGTFGLLALILAAIGTYGVMSYSVSQRRNEIGIRMALGAQPSNVLRLILSSGMAMVIAGICAGLAFSLLLAKSMNSLLYGIGMFDAASFLTTAGLLILVALGACYIPARRAMKVDPIVALRYE
ncbi:MAG TPA: ABC transporter permease [Candidatus Acidoferrales bacterium]|nr:ABC transporter permease [Candidatus Acidoferrales bacterium]